MTKKLIIVFIVFFAIAVGIFYILTTGNPGAKYNTVEVKRGEVGVFVQEVGRIASRNIRRYYGGGVSKVAEMSLELGDHVKKGQLLIRFEDHLDLEIQKVEKQIEALEATYDEALSGTDMSRLNSARIEVTRIKNDLNVAEKNRDRTEALYNNGGASYVELEQANNLVAQYRSSLGIAQNTYNQLTQGISENIKGKYEAEIDVLLLTLEILKNDQEQYATYADMDGVVTEINTFVGDTPAPGLLMIEVQDPAEKVILVDFLVEVARQIRPDMKAEISDLTLNLQIDDLKVSRVYPKAFVSLSELGVEENRQTVEIGLTKDSESLDYGVEVATRVMIEAPRETLLIPVGAVLLKDSQQVVKVLENGKIVERAIETGIESGGNIEVNEGLQEGELIILNYQDEAN